MCVRNNNMMKNMKNHWIHSAKKDETYAENQSAEMMLAVSAEYLNCWHEFNIFPSTRRCHPSRRRHRHHRASIAIQRKMENKL